jgi:hypothetical protein
MNNEQEWPWKKMAVASLKVPSREQSGGSEECHENGVTIDMKEGPPGYEAGVLTT